MFLLLVALISSRFKLLLNQRYEICRAWHLKADISLATSISTKKGHDLNVHPPKKTCYLFPPNQSLPFRNPIGRRGQRLPLEMSLGVGTVMDDTVKDLAEAKSLGATFALSPIDAGLGGRVLGASGKNRKRKTKEEKRKKKKDKRQKKKKGKK